jgi:hypothetical protein
MDKFCDSPLLSGWCIHRDSKSQHWKIEQFSEKSERKLKTQHPHTFRWPPARPTVAICSLEANLELSTQSCLVYRR